MGRAAAGVGRERILEAALDLFAVNGVAATSLQAIADRLGISVHRVQRAMTRALTHCYRALYP